MVILRILQAVDRVFFRIGWFLSGFCKLLIQWFFALDGFSQDIASGWSSVFHIGWYFSEYSKLLIECFSYWVVFLSILQAVDRVFFVLGGFSQDIACCCSNVSPYWWFSLDISAVDRMFFSNWVVFAGYCKLVIGWFFVLGGFSQDIASCWFNVLPYLVVFLRILQAVDRVFFHIGCFLSGYCKLLIECFTILGGFLQDIATCWLSVSPYWVVFLRILQAVDWVFHRAGWFFSGYCKLLMECFTVLVVFLGYCKLLVKCFFLVDWTIIYSSKIRLYVKTITG